MSALALGPDADAPFLKELARRGGGRFYQAPSPRELPRLFLREGQEVFRGRPWREGSPWRPGPTP